MEIVKHFAKIGINDNIKAFDRPYLHYDDVIYHVMSV